MNHVKINCCKWNDLKGKLTPTQTLALAWQKTLDRDPICWYCYRRTLKLCLKWN